MTEQDYINEQIRLSAQLHIENTVNPAQVQAVAGVDLAYWKEADGQEHAVCCIVVINYPVSYTHLTLPTIQQV